MCCPQEVTGEQAEPMSHSQVCPVRTVFFLCPWNVHGGLSSAFFSHPVLWAGAGPGGQATASLEYALHLQ